MKRTRAHETWEQWFNLCRDDEEKFVSEYFKKLIFKYELKQTVMGLNEDSENKMLEHCKYRRLLYLTNLDAFLWLTKISDILIKHKNKIQSIS